jgi:acyl-[acyl-carrier-protein]-phospholipid O-acyltransferase/long-chain-fatty-acid--[acyl-carrier-protein] ligase
MVKALLRVVFRLFFRIEVRGSVQPHPKLLIISNHQSFLDAFAVGAFLRVRPVWVVHTAIARLWYFRIGLRFIPHITLDTRKPMAMKAVVALVESGQPVLIFPEGRITVTGSLMKIYEGPAMVAVRTGATVVPVHVEGAVYSVFSRMSGDFPRRLFPRITVTVREPGIIDVPGTVSGKTRRRLATEQLRRLMQRAAFEARPRTTLFPALLDAIALHGRGRRLLEDVRETPETYGQFLKATLALGRIAARLAREGENVGVLMPNVSTTAALLFGMFAMRRIPAMLNYSAGLEAMGAACRLGAVHTIVTSRAFLEKARLTAVPEKLPDMRWVYLEDLRSTFGWRDKLWLVRALAFPRSAARRAQPDDPAVVLFTSGSEGRPKGVVLSHASILANIAQILAVVDVTCQDKFLSALPLFHAFGLTVGAILPLICGCRVFLYPSPLHYRLIPETIYDRDCTILFATATFLGHYGRFAHPYDFRCLRLAVAGAEKLGEDVRQLYAEKFGIRVIEGYGASECSPVISANVPMAASPRTTGELLPGMEYRLAEVAGIAEGGLLHVRGPNVMLGYLRPDRPGTFEPVHSEYGPGWYNTGDLVSVSEAGAVTILGRMRRFAKVAGEMVSLDVVERIAVAASPGFQHASASCPQPGRGELILLFTEDAGLERERLQKTARDLGAPDMAVARRIVHISKVPMLGNGKKDYVTLQAMAAEAVSAVART